MTPEAAAALAAEIATDLKLAPEQRHALRQAAAALVALPDDLAVQQRAHELSERFRTQPVLAGAVLVTATGITVERFAGSLDAVSRQKYLGGLHGVDRAGDVEGE